jgi:hypothetical protein
LTIARFTALLAAALAVVLAVPLAVSAALPGGAKYVGQTNDGQGVLVRLTGDAKHVKRMRIHYTVTCDDQRSGDTYTDILNLRVRSDNTFRGAGMYTGSGDGSENKFKVTGKLTSKKANGTFSLTATGTPPGSQGTVHCKTGKLTWQATRQP